MKRLIVALLVGGMVFGVAFAVAETLPVEGGAIQAGEDTNLACQQNHVVVLGWGLETSDGLVYNVRLGNIEDVDCDGNDLFVVITDDGVAVRDGKVTIASGTTTYTIPLTTLGIGNTTPSPYPAEDITDIEVFIEGPNGD